MKHQAAKRLSALFVCVMMMTLPLLLNRLQFQSLLTNLRIILTVPPLSVA